MFKKNEILNFIGRINAFRVIEHPERIDILGSQNTESVKLCIRTDYDKCNILFWIYRLIEFFS